jgi:transposase
MNSRSYETIRKLSREKFSMSAFVQLKTLAKNTVGRTDDYLLSEMDVILELYNQLDAKIQEIEEQVVTCIRGINPPILSIPGIGALSAAIILSEYGDLSKYDSPAKLLSFAGLEPGYFQSGQSEHTGRMVKHGSSHLRCALMNCCLPLITNEPVFAEYYAKKRSEGKPYRVAMTHVAKKLLRVIYTLQTTNVTYDPELIR